MSKTRTNDSHEMNERAIQELANTLTAIEIVSKELADIQERSEVADPNKVKSLIAISVVSRIFAEKVKSGEYKPESPEASTT